MYLFRVQREGRVRPKKQRSTPRRVRFRQVSVFGAPSKRGSVVRTLCRSFIAFTAYVRPTQPSSSTPPNASSHNGTNTSLASSSNTCTYCKHPAHTESNLLSQTRFSQPRW